MSGNKTLRIACIVMLFALAMPAAASSIVKNEPQTSSASGPEDPRAQQLVQRLEQIRSMDKSNLSTSEKRSLRKEVKQTRKEMKALSGGVYLSVGALIIVILLLILLL